MDDTTDPTKNNLVSTLFEEYKNNRDFATLLVEYVNIFNELSEKICNLMDAQNEPQGNLKPGVISSPQSRFVCVACGEPPLNKRLHGEVNATTKEEIGPFCDSCAMKHGIYPWD